MLRSFDRAMDQVIRTRLRETAIGLLPQAFTEIGLARGHGPARRAESGRGRRTGTQLLFGVFAVAALRLMPSVRSIMAAGPRSSTTATRSPSCATQRPRTTFPASPDTLSGAAERAGKAPYRCRRYPPSNTPRRSGETAAAGERLRTNDRIRQTTAPYGQTAPANALHRKINEIRFAATHPEHARPKYCLST